MGKAIRFLKSLLRFKSTEPVATQPSGSEPKPNHKQSLRRRLSFVQSHKDNPPRRLNATKSLDVTSLPHHTEWLEGGGIDRNYEDQNKQAIAVAVATAAVVDAAVVAAEAAAEVVKLTSRTVVYGVREELAAVKIQSCFRAYLARRALKGLKALVKLQAVVRGHILRKHTADMMGRLQTLIRAQTSARALRSQIVDSTTKPSSYSHHHKNDSKSSTQSVPVQETTIFGDPTVHENENFIEIDIVEPHVMTRRRKLSQTNQLNLTHSQSLTTSRRSTMQRTSSSPCASCEVNSFESLMRDGSRSWVSRDSDHPNDKANTESLRAKPRSLSAPRLRAKLEDSDTDTKDSCYRYGLGVQWVPTMLDNFARKTYPGSGRLDRLGMPVYGSEESEICAGYWNYEPNKGNVIV